MCLREKSNQEKKNNRQRADHKNETLRPMCLSPHQAVKAMPCRLEVEALVPSATRGEGNALLRAFRSKCRLAESDCDVIAFQSGWEARVLVI